MSCKWILKEIVECKFLASSVSADDVSMLHLSPGGPGSSDKFPSAASAPGSGAASEQPVWTGTSSPSKRGESPC